MDQEIEMNFKVKDKAGLLAFLRGQANERVSEIRMTYLGGKDNDSFYIRIEEINDQSGEKKFLTAKGNFKNDEHVSRRKEITLPIADNPLKYIDFLLLIGMELRDSKQKTRHQFNIDGLSITLDEWKVEELSDRLEIEGNSEEEIKAFSSKILQFCDQNPSN